MPISLTERRAPDWSRSDEAEALDPAELCARLRTELAELEPVVSAAALAATAFRLRDEEGLVAALRVLTEALDELERRRPPGA